MKVLMFGWEFPPFISGGLGTACYGMTKHLTQQDVSVTFVVPRIKGHVDTHVELIGANQVPYSTLDDITCFLTHGLEMISVDSALTPYLNELTYKEHKDYLNSTTEQRIKTANVTNSDIITLSGDYENNLLDEVARYAAVGARLGNRENFDVIHAHDWMTFPAGIAAKRVSGKPLVVHVHATEFDRSGMNINTDVYAIEQNGMREADRIITVSHRTKEMVTRNYDIPESKITVVHNGIEPETTVDVSDIKKGVDEKIVLFLGRITQQKGPEYFIEAAHMVYQQLKNVRFVMAGNGDMLPAMIERVAKLGMVDRFHFTGFLRGKKTEMMYAMSDLYIMPSVSEPFGLTPFEAMKYGVPIILSKQSGASELLGDVIKVDFWDTRKLASSIVDILTKPNIAKTMVEANTLTLPTISWDKAATKIKNIYQELQAV